MLLQVHNVAKRDVHDENVNIQTMYGYNNPNKDELNHDSFYGGFVDMERCLYMFNAGYNSTPSSSTKLVVQKATLNIVYNRDILRKNTEIVFNYN